MWPIVPYLMLYSMLQQQNAPITLYLLWESFFKPIKMKGDRSCLYRAVASQIISFCLQDIWTERFTDGNKPEIKQAASKVVNDVKE